MANSTPKISGAGIGILIEETPACTPVPQASSTAAHRNSDRYLICNLCDYWPDPIRYYLFVVLPLFGPESYVTEK
jgi:hypothetical protein